MAVLIAFSFIAAFVVQWGAGLSRSPVPARESTNLSEDIATLKSRIESNPKDVSSVIKLTSLYQEKKEFKKAEILYSKALKSNPNDERLEMAAGGLYLINQKPDKSAPHFLKAVKLSPSAPLASMGLAYSYEMLGKKELAIKTLRTFLKAYPKSGYAETIAKELKRLGEGRKLPN